MNFLEALEYLAIRLSNGRRQATSETACARQSKGYLLGTIADESEEFALDLAAPQHLYMIGSSGSGKTTQLRRLLDADIAERRSVVVLDLHGDLCPLIIASLAGNNIDPARVLYWNLAGEALLPGINPLISGGEVHRRVNGIVNAIKRRSDSWGVQLDQTLRAVLVSLAEQNYSLVEVEVALSHVAFRAFLKKRTADRYAREFLERFDTLSKEQQQTQLLAVSNKLTPYTADPHMRRLLGTGDLGVLRKALNTPKSITLISLPGYALGEMSGVIGEMIINSIWNTILSRAKVHESQRTPVRLVVDEFQNAMCDQFGSMVTEGRRFGLSLVLSHQSQAQLPNSLRSLIRNNSAVRVLLAPGVVDAGELATELAPFTHTEATQEFLGLKVGEAFVVRRGERAVKVQLRNVEAPRVSQDAVNCFVTDVTSRSAKQIEEIDAELAKRINTIEALSVGASNAQPEVRHGRRPWR